MKKKFNITGVCIPEKHYVVNLENKIQQVFSLVEEGDYFTINRPRQYGKTTLLYFLADFINQKEDFLVLNLSFEGMGDSPFSQEKHFIQTFLEMLEEEWEFLSDPFPTLPEAYQKENIDDFKKLSRWIRECVKHSGKKIVLLIDEVDQSSNHNLFLYFLGMLRDKYLKRSMGKDFTFHSVILAGVHDVKSLKMKIRKPEESQKLNSPWNIAAEYTVKMSFQEEDIATMLEDYKKEKKIEMNVPEMSKQLYYYTSGYPFLVSKLCKVMDEELMQEKQEWTPGMLEQATQNVLENQNTNFETLIKNLENEDSLYQMAFELLILGDSISFNQNHPDIHLGVIYGVFKKENGSVKIHNRIYEQLIYNYLTSKMRKSIQPKVFEYQSTNFLSQDGTLDFEKVLTKFQQFMKAEYSEKDKDFLERNGRLLFLTFLKPILNGRGFDFKEVETSEEKRIDVVVTFLHRKYVVELKLWRGLKAHEKGLRQLADYLEGLSLDQGYLLIFDLRKEENKEWKKEKSNIDQKKILSFWV